MYNKEQQFFLTGVALFIMSLAIAFCILFLYSCTYNISMVHSEGEASDVIDTQQTPTSDLKADFSLTKP